MSGPPSAAAAPAVVTAAPLARLDVGVDYTAIEREILAGIGA